METKLGPDHFDVALVLNNLASFLYMTNRATEAEPLMRRALSIYEKSFGAEHPEVASSLSNLAQFIKVDQPEEAEPLLRRAIAILEKSAAPSILTLQSLSTIWLSC